MYCQGCGKEIANDVAFCSGCGRGVARQSGDISCQPASLQSSRPGKKRMGLAILLGCAVLLLISSLARDDKSNAATQPAYPGSSVAVGTPTAPSALSVPSDKWQEEIGKSQMDGSKTVTLSLDGNEEIRGWIGSHRPTLILRCMEHKTELYIDVGTAASVESGDLYDGHTVRLRIDQRPSFSEKWSESTDHEALFAPEPISLIRKIEHGDRLLFQFVPFNANPATTSFDTKGLSSHVDDLAKTCGWKP